MWPNPLGRVATTRNNFATWLPGHATLRLARRLQSFLSPTEDIAMIFRQLFDRETCTYTYLLGDEETREAVLIDPVREHVDRDSQILEELGLTLKYTLDTHVHADHVTGAGLLRERHGNESVLSANGGAPCVNLAVEHGARVEFGRYALEVRATPGHTDGCLTYVTSDHTMAFTGDAMLIRGCGRTDFQQGSARVLYQSIHEQLFTLPDACAIYPGHDYKGRTSSTVGEEKAHNPRLGGGRDVESFVEIMDNLGLAPPKHLAEALPANQNCGLPIRGPVPKRPAGWESVVRNDDGVPEVDVRWVFANREAVRVVDVREHDEVAASDGTIAGAEVVPADLLDNAASSWDRYEPVLLVCRSGMRSGRAAARLEALHFANVASMRGGMMAWGDAGLPAER